MKKKDHILNILANSQFLNSALDKLCKDEELKQEGKQELFVALLEMPEEKLVRLYEQKKLKYWIIKVLQNFFFSSKSTFYNKFRKFTRSNVAIGNDNILDFYAYVGAPKNNDEISLNKLESFDNRISELPEFDRRLIKKFLAKGCSYTEVAKELELTHRIVWLEIKRILKVLRDQIQDDIANIHSTTRENIGNTYELEEDNPGRAAIKRIGRNKSVDAWEHQNYNQIK